MSIILKDQGIDIPSKKNLRNIFRNHDRAYILYNTENKVHIIKNIKSFNHLEKSIKQLDNDYGLRNISCIFYFCDKKTIYELIIIKDDIIAVVNDQNDDFHFIQEVLETFYEYDSNFFKNPTLIKVIRLLFKSVNAVITGKGDIYRFKTYTKDKDECYYSDISNIASKLENKTVVEDTGEVFEELLNGIVLEEQEFKEADEFEKLMNKIEVLEVGEKVWSRDYSCEFEATPRIVLGIDNHRNLYEINFSKKKLDIIARNVHIRLKKTDKPFK